MESLQQASAGQLSLRAKRRAQAAVAELQGKLKAWEKSQRAASGAGVDPVAAATSLLSDAQPLGPGKLIVGSLNGAAHEQLLSAMDSLKKKAGSYGIMLGSAEDGKVNFVAAVSDDLIAMGLKAGDWIRETAKVAGGGGGGRPQMAQAGGKDPSKLQDALETARKFAREKVPS
jgi:alanyl-tRNA synthetase